MAVRCPQDFVDLAQRMADAAGEPIRRHFRSPLTVDTKADASPVTIADREAEQAIRAIIDAELPDHGIEGEEFGIKAGGPWKWILDPIDGTKCFIAGLPVFGTLIGLTHDGAPALGLMDQPIARERWIAHGDAATTLNGAVIAARRGVGLADAILFTAGPDYLAGSQTVAFDRLSTACGLTRYGVDCYAFGMLAAGFVDIAVEVNVQAYDVAALVPIVENAGGVMTDWKGAPLRLEGGIETVIAAATPELHEAALARLDF